MLTRIYFVRLKTLDNFNDIFTIGFVGLEIGLIYTNVSGYKRVTESRNKNVNSWEGDNRTN